MSAVPITNLGALREWAPQKEAGEDAVLDRCILAASEMLEAETGRRFIQPAADLEVALDGSGARVGGRYREVLYLPHRPLVSVTSVTENGTALTLATGYSTTAQVIVDLQGGRLIRRAGSDTLQVDDHLYVPGWASGTRNIAVAYLPGYGQTAPLDIEQVCIELAWLLYKGGNMVGTASYSRAGQARSFINELSAASRATIVRYRDTARA